MRNVLITGGSRGIGKAISEKFLECSYSVFCPTREELDLSNSESIENFLSKNTIEFDVIINNAGINDISLVENIKDSEIDNIIAVNLVAPIKLLRGLVPNMKKNNYGRIVNISSIWAIVSKEGRSLYSATKNAIHGITNTLALELAGNNILVNTVCPGFVMTELTKKNNSEHELDAIRNLIPLERLAEPKEIAEVVFFLCSDNNTYITGQKICIDGGYTVK